MACLQGLALSLHHPPINTRAGKHSLGMTHSCIYNPLVYFIYSCLIDDSVTSYWLTALAEGAEGPPPTCVSAAQFFFRMLTERMTPLENLWLLIISIGGIKGWTKTFDIPIEISIA